MQKNKAVSMSESTGAVGGAGARNLDIGTSRRKVTNADRWLVRQLYTLLDDPSLQLRLWNGEEFSASDDGELVARVIVRERKALYRLLGNPNLHFGDLYSAGTIDVEGDLAAALEIAYRAPLANSKIAQLHRRLPRVLRGERTNSLRGSRHNIHHHYDIGNDFYKLWLDPDYMQYTCAYYPSQDMTLDQAQVAKLEHVCRKLQLQPGESVVEAGCGWGGLARYMARHYGVKVRSYNISHQQIVYARERAEAEGLAGQVEYVEDDYRNISGEYDVFVSIGMLEHVGRDNYQQMGGVVDRCLKDNGRGLIHSIGRNRPAPMNAWIEKRIFPGAYPPSLREMMDIFEPWELSVLDVENLHLHYARTLEHWLERYEHNAEHVQAMFDRHFVRAWRLYLAGSFAAFTTGALQLFQVLFSRPKRNDLPWSRAHLYRE